MRFFLALRAIVFVLLLPGTVAGYVPYRILRAADRLDAPDPSFASVAAFVVCGVGVAGLGWCVWDFFAAGKGTLAPVDPPRHLVVCGLYRFTRNPMYNAVITVLLGEAWLFRSINLISYALFAFVMFHLFVVLYEEPALTSRFGDSYRAYKRAVPRWGFIVRPFRQATHPR
jgi:protein-S-isoprenylcysteine O-methyltransferase Ste14